MSTFSELVKNARIKKQVEACKQMAENARSLKGAPLPKAIIDRLCKLQAERPELLMEIGSANGLVRDLSFFKKYSVDLSFFDMDGNAFAFSSKSKPVMHNQIFVGISYSEKYNRIRVYARFPGER